MSRRCRERRKSECNSARSANRSRLLVILQPTLEHRSLLVGRLSFENAIDEIIVYGHYAFSIARRRSMQLARTVRTRDSRTRTEPLVEPVSCAISSADKFFDVPQIEQPARLWREFLQTGFQRFATVAPSFSLNAAIVSASLAEQVVGENNPRAILSPIEINHPRFGDPQRPSHERPTRVILVKSTRQLLSDPLNDVFSIVKSGD